MFTTPAQVKAAKTVELVTFYNQHVERPIKKFENRDTAEKRVLALLPIVKKEATKEEKEDGKRAEYNSRIIEVSCEKNPKRDGTRAHKKFQILMDFDGKTIGEFRDQEGKHKDLDEEVGWPSTELRWAIKLNLIKNPVRVTK
jgi:hypothetical protein